MATGTVGLCRWRVRTNALWLWWYCAIVLGFQGYLLYRAIGRCRRYNELHWSDTNRPVGELYTFIVLIVISVTCLPFFVVTTLFKVGNLASDGVRLGRDALPEVTAETEVTTKKAWFRFAWRHLGPINCSIHVMASFALLLPRVFLQSQEIHHGFVHKEAVWSTEHGVHVVAGVANKTLAYTSDSYGLSPEFVSYVLALAIYGIRYAAVFWHTKALFSALFSVQMLFTTLQLIIAFCGMAVLYKLRMNAHYFGDAFTILPTGVVMLLYLAASAVVFVSPISVFNYGYAHYRDAFLERKRKDLQQHQRPPVDNSRCQGYAPHSMATAVLMLTVGLRAPIVYDYVSVYRSTGRRLMLAATIVDVCYMLAWVVTWTALTVKQTWSFSVSSSCFHIKPVTDAHLASGAQQTTVSHQIVTNGVNHYQLAVATDDACDARPLCSPTSAMRKSKDRRSATNQKVTFDDAVRRTNPDTTTNTYDVRIGASKIDNGVIRRPGRSPQQRPLSDSSIDQSRWYSGTGSTPDNTLTRDYRHSIRDKCGEFYRHSMQCTSPPAAHSSPVTMRRQQEMMSKTIVHSAPAAMGMDEYMNERYGLSPIYAADKDADRSDWTADDSSNIRRRRPQYGMESPDWRWRDKTPRVYGDSPMMSTSPLRPPMPDHSQNCRTRNASIPKATPHLSDVYVPTNLNSQQNSINNPLKSQQRTTPSAAGPRRGILRLPPISPVTSKTKAMHLASHHTKVSHRKPDLHRRDSALPSSNETSSNDSTDVLCSQV